MLSEQTVSFIFPGDIVNVTPSGSFLTPATAMGMAKVRTTEKKRAQTNTALRKRFVPLFLGCCCFLVNAKSHCQSSLRPTGKTEISAALVQPFALISRKAVKRKNRALTGAKPTI